MAGQWVVQHEQRLRSDLRFQNLVVLLAFAIPLALAYGTFQRNKVWDNTESLWYDVTIKSPENGRGLMNYGLALMRKEDAKGALDYYNKALVHSPYYPYLHINMALCKTQLQHPLPEIEDHYKKALQYGPSYYGGFHYYGIWLWQQGRYIEAIDNLKLAISKAPAVLFSRSMLMQLYASQQMWPELHTLASETLASFPDNEEALKYLSQTEQKGIKKDEAYYINLGLNYYNAGQYDTAIESWEEALALNPGSALIHNNIGSAYNAMKEYKKAIPWLEKALAIDPGFNLAANNLKLAKENSN
jgi:tetratricopeptide (TPR) repeat protein